MEAQGLLFFLFSLFTFFFAMWSSIGYSVSLGLGIINKNGMYTCLLYLVRQN